MITVKNLMSILDLFGVYDKDIPLYIQTETMKNTSKVFMCNRIIVQKVNNGIQLTLSAK